MQPNTCLQGKVIMPHRLRGITTAADANLAAVNYHFGSKEALLEAVIVRRLDPLNEIRSGQLEALSAKGRTRPVNCLPAETSCERLSSRPCACVKQGSEAEDFIALIGRILAEPRGIAMTIFLQHMGPLMQRSVQALALSLPALSEQDLFWRMHFTLGSLSHIMRCHERHSMVPENVKVDVPVEDLIEPSLILLPPVWR